MKAQSLLETRETENITNAINRRKVAEFISRLGREMEDMAEVLFEKESSTPAMDTAIFLRSSWLTSGVFALTNQWDSPKEFEDDGKVIFLRSSWITAGTEPRCK